MVKFWYIPEKTQYIDSFRLHYSMKKAELSIFAAQKIHRFPGFSVGVFVECEQGQTVNRDGWLSTGLSTAQRLSTMLSTESGAALALSMLSEHGGG